LFSIAQHEDLFPPEVKTDLPELILLRRYLGGPRSFTRNF
jgi:hypothetical protein